MSDGEAGRAAFGETSTAMDVVAGLDLTGRTAIVTGAASGIGVETARALAAAGAHVVLAVRDVLAGEATAADIHATTGQDELTVRHLDLADISTVDEFASSWRGPLDILINNAGIMMTPEAHTRDGVELQFATNHLGHFALALGLVDWMSDVEDPRIVSVSSSGHASSPVVFSDISFERRPYDPGAAYGQSKTANVLFAVEAHRRWAPRGITANAVMPGGIWTNLQRHWEPVVLAAMKQEHAGKTAQQGAATSVYVATAPLLKGIGGRYFEDCGEAAVVPMVIDGLHGVLGHALDPQDARTLWEVSLDLVERARHSPGDRPDQRVVEPLPAWLLDLYLILSSRMMICKRRDSGTDGPEHAREHD